MPRDAAAMQHRDAAMLWHRDAASRHQAGIITQFTSV
jgi:hypothetical protein